MQMPNISPDRKFIITVILGAVFIVAVGAFFFFTKKDAIVSNEFTGTITKVEGNTIYAKGVFISPDHPEVSGVDRITEVRVILGSGSELTRTMLILPSQAELIKNNRIYYPDKLEKEQKTVDIQNLVSDMRLFASPQVFIRSSKNIFNKSEIKPDQVEYRIQIAPEFRSRLGI